jgi:hypothetical protein
VNPADEIDIWDVEFLKLHSTALLQHDGLLVMLPANYHQLSEDICDLTVKIDD